MRSQTVALIAAARTYNDVVVRAGIASFAYLLKKPVEFVEAPELFCLDLYRYFDLDRIAVLVEPSPRCLQRIRVRSKISDFLRRLLFHPKNGDLLPVGNRSFVCARTNTNGPPRCGLGNEADSRPRGRRLG